MFLPSLPPHDFWLTLDCADYFLREQDPEAIYEKGFVRPLSLSTRDVLFVAKFNENPEEPGFDVSFPGQELTASEITEATAQIARILGLNLDLRPLMEQAVDDFYLGAMVQEQYGFKRIAGASIFEDAFSDIIKSRISHRPTAKKMDQSVRRAFGTRFEHGGEEYFAYPRPENLVSAAPASFREFGISERKAEYIIGMATQIHDGTLDLQNLEEMAPSEFYFDIQKIRGIGPSTAQTLMLHRNRTDASFPSHITKGEEKGMRRWVIHSYGKNPADVSDEDFEDLISAWKGFEALAIEFLYYRWVLSQLKKN
jgi:DNA-3-methyladenine glycosylase II